MIFLAQIQASPAGEIQHDGKNPYLHTVKYGSKYGIMTYSTSELFSASFLRNIVQIIHEAGGEIVISLFLETHVYPCVDRHTNIFTALFLLQNKPHENNLYSLPIITEKD